MSTVAVYQARNQAITETIRQLDIDKKQHRAEQAYYKNLKDNWYNSMRPCPKNTLKRKEYQDCLADLQYRQDKSNGYKASELSSKESADNIEFVQIPILNAEFDANLDLIAQAQLSASDVAKELSRQGLTYEGSTNKSTLQGEGDKSAKTTIGEAQAKSLLIHAEVDSKNKKNVGYAVAAGGFLMVVIVAVVLFKKIKNR